MNTWFFVIVVLVAVLATLAISGYIFYLITKRYFDNQQKMQMLQIEQKL